MALFIATIQILIEADDETEACDTASEALTHNLILEGVFQDWQYLSPQTYPNIISKDQARELFTDYED